MDSKSFEESVQAMGAAALETSMTVKDFNEILREGRKREPYYNRQNPLHRRNAKNRVVKVIRGKK